MNPLDRLMPRLERLEEIAGLAAQVRSAQRRYDRGRERDVRIEAKTLEARLDAALAALAETDNASPEREGARS